MRIEECLCKDKIHIEFDEDEQIELTDEEICELSDEFPVLYIYDAEVPQEAKQIEKVVPIIVEANKPLQCGEKTIVSKPGIYLVDKREAKKLL